MFDQFESMLDNGSLSMQSNYPPYNIRKTGKDNYSIEVALAGFNKKDVEVEFRSLRTESFTGAVVRTRSEVQADMVVLFAARPQGATSRLVLFPSERIARELTVPVLTFPLTTEGPPEPLHKGRRWPWSG